MVVNKLKICQNIVDDKESRTSCTSCVPSLVAQCLALRTGQTAYAAPLQWLSSDTQSEETGFTLVPRLYSENGEGGRLRRGKTNLWPPNSLHLFPFQRPKGSQMLSVFFLSIYMEHVLIASLLAWPVNEKNYQLIFFNSHLNKLFVWFHGDL